MNYMTDAMVTLGAEVRRLRLRAKLSQEKLGERLGISREAVSKIERGETQHPSDETLVGLEAHLGLSRQKAHQLMGALPKREEADASALIQTIAALPDHQSRMAAWMNLSPLLRQSVMQFAQDLLQDAERRVRESLTQTALDR